MTAFDPKRGKHSVVEVAFAIYFNGTINADSINRAKSRRTEYAEFLPGESGVQGFQLNLGVGVSNAPTSVAQIQEGFSWQRINPDGSLAWRLSVLQDHVVVNCADYTRWEEVWKRVAPWLFDMYQQITAGGHSATSFSLQVIDQFTRKQPVTKHILRELFSDKSIYLPKRLFENDELWHLYQGWFSEQGEPLRGQKLNVINISASRVADINTVSLDHLMRVNLASNSPPLLKDAMENSPLETLLNALHSENKAVLRDILTPDVVQSIGLVE
jgi:uncharacterized protein (TIGR04255 family)